MQFGAPPVGGNAATASGIPGATSAGGASAAAHPFKSQLYQLSQELDGFSRRVGGGGGGTTAAASVPHSGGESVAGSSHAGGAGPPSTAAGLGYRDKEELRQQVGGLHRTMEQVNNHLEVERLEKRQLQDELDQVRIHMSLQQRQQEETAARTAALPDAAAALERQLRASQEEVASLREEKAVMREWLDRGVGECRRVAEEVQRLRRELDDTDGERGRLGDEKARLEALLERAAAQERETAERLEQERRQKEAALDDVASGTRTMHESGEQLRQTQGECDRLAAEVARLMERVRETEDAEMHLRTLASGLRRTSNGYLAFHAAVEQDRLGELLGRPADDAATTADAEAAGSGPLAGVANHGRACLAELQDVLLALRAVVRGRLEDTQNRCADVAKRESAEAARAVEGAARVEQELRERHSVEQRMLEGKLQELEYELSGMSETNVKSQVRLTEAEQETEALRRRLQELERDGGANGGGKPGGAATYANPSEHAAAHMQDLRRFEGNDEELAARAMALEARCLKLEASNAKMKEKNKKMKIDWGSVSDTRQYCQKLELEKRTMQGYIEKVELENESLRRRVHNNTVGHAQRATSPSKRMELEQSSQAWREWQRAQSSFETWKSQASAHGQHPAEAGGESFVSPSKLAPPRYTQASAGVTTPLQAYHPPVMPTSGPWHPSS